MRKLENYTIDELLSYLNMSIVFRHIYLSGFNYMEFIARPPEQYVPQTPDEEAIWEEITHPRREIELVNLPSSFELRTGYSYYSTPDTGITAYLYWCAFKATHARRAEGPPANSGKIGEELVRRFGDFRNNKNIHAWLALKSRLPRGTPVSGKVISRYPFGVYVDIEIGFPALLEVMEFKGAESDRYRNHLDFPEVNSEITGRVVRLNDRTRQVILTQRLVHPLLDRN